MPEPLPAPLIDLRPDHWAIVSDILQRCVPEREVWAFGSRARWTAKQYSDLDLVVIGDQPLTLAEMTTLSDAFTESDLPFKVDVVDWATTKENFRSLIRRDKVVVQQGAEGEASSLSDDVGTGMTGGWALIRLGEACAKIGSGATPRGGSEVYLESGQFSLIRSQNIHNDGFRKGGLAYINTRQAADLANAEVLPGDVLLNITGDSVARACQVARDALPARVNQHVAIIRPKHEILDARFLQYFLVSPEMQTKLLSWAGSGGTRNALTKGMIESFNVPAPVDVGEQRAIAHILGTLDDKIELNRKMAATLEAMARALFKDSLDQGSEERRLDELCDIFDGPHATPNTVSEGPLFLGISNLADGRLDLSTTRHVTEEDFTRWTKRVTPEPGDIVFSYETRLGEVARIPKGLRCCLGRRMGLLRPKRGKITSTILLYAYLSSSFQEVIRARTIHGSTVDRIPLIEMGGFPIIVPLAETRRRIAPVLENLRQRMEQGFSESQTLAALRDTLLPKLISGSLRIKDAERFLERRGL